MCNFASVFHGIRFKVRRLFVVMTSNFFLYPCSNGYVIGNVLFDASDDWIPVVLPPLGRCAFSFVSVVIMLIMLKICIAKPKKIANFAEISGSVGISCR